MAASLGMALLLASYGLRAQERISTLPTPGGATFSGTTTLHQTLPQVSVTESDSHEVGHDGHEGGHEAEEESEGEEAWGGLYGNADFLLLRPRRQPHDFAIIDPVGSGPAVQGDVAHFNWDTVGAYRVGLGYKLNNGFEIGASYTYAHSKDNEAIARPNGGALFATQSAPFTFDSTDGAVASSNLDLDSVDIEFAKRIEACTGLELRLVGGARIASIKQKEEIAYDFTSVGFGISNVNNSIQFDGAGPRIGGEGWWKMWRGFGAYGKAYGSLLTGNFSTHLTQFVNSGTTVAVDVGDHFHKVVPVTEMGVGFGWKGDHMSFMVGVEVQNYFGLVQILDFPSGTSFKPFYHTGDLSLEALTASIAFTF
jgi:hypothetical protein